MEAIKITGWILFYLVNAILAFYFTLPILLSVLSLFIKKKKPFLVANKPDTNFAAIVTCHQDTRFIAPLVDSFLKQTYPYFTLYIVADDSETQHLNFDNEKVILLKPAPALHSKIKSINYAIDHFKQRHDALVIFDSDNLVHPEYFNQLNGYFVAGFKVVQSHMLSKNIDSTFAKLDSVGHIYYTFTERIVKMQLGIHSAILGLGIALDTTLYKNIRYKDTIGGFDKKLQSQLAIAVPQIAFAENAIVYDEKIEERDALEKQRTRWIYTYFKHFKDSLKLFLNGIKTFSAGRILLGSSMLRPPMFLLLLATFFSILFSAFIQPVVSLIWIALLFFYGLNFACIIAFASKQKGMLQSLLFIPLMIMSQLRSLLKMKAAKTNFLKTEHKKIIYIDELLENEPI